MPVQILLYLPVGVDTNDSNYEFPTIDNHIIKYSQILNNPTSNADEEDQNQNRYRSTSPELKALAKFHESQRGWFPLLAWSHGVSGPTIRSWSCTRYSDALSPQLAVLILRKESIPHALLRCLYVPQDGKMTVLEYEMQHVKIGSQSGGGSGGQDKLTNNITVEAKVFTTKQVIFDVATGEKIKESVGTWDVTQEKGVRAGVSKTIINQVAEPLPEKGRKFAISNSDRKMFREIYVKSLTFAALRTAVTEKLKVDASKLKAIYFLDGKSRLVEIEDDKKVVGFEDGETIVYELEVEK